MRKKLLFFILFVLMITGIAVGIHDYFHWQVMLATETFTESTEKIWNPNRGFYHIYGFLISDESADMSEQSDAKRYRSCPCHGADQFKGIPGQRNIKGRSAEYRKTFSGDVCDKRALDRTVFV